MKSTLRILLAALTLAVGASSVSAQEGSVVIPSQMELNEEQKAELQTKLDKELTAVVKTCIAQYPRPEFYTALAVQYDLRKSGELRGGYVPGGAIDSNVYLASDEAKAKLEADGSLARTIVRDDRDVERCMKKGTRSFETEFKRYSASVNAVYEIGWKGKSPKLTATTFDVTKN